MNSWLDQVIFFIVDEMFVEMNFIVYYGFLDVCLFFFDFVYDCDFVVFYGELVVRQFVVLLLFDVLLMEECLMIEKWIVRQFQIVLLWIGVGIVVECVYIVDIYLFEGVVIVFCDVLMVFEDCVMCIYEVYQVEVMVVFFV